MATKKGRITIFFCCYLEGTGSGIRDPGFGMDKSQDPGSGKNIPDPQQL